jgi:uncharacterized protein (DUF342 family)
MIVTVIEREDSKSETIEGDLNKNIESSGSVFVKGNIQAGLKVLCHGSLTVNGMVLASDLVCHGDLSAEQGIFSSHQVQIIVKGHVKTLSVSNALLDVEKNITVKADVVNSNIRCRNLVTIGGAIEGGDVAAALAVSTGRIGKVGQVPDATKVEAGTNFRLKVMQDEMEKEIAEISDKADKIRNAVNALEIKEKAHYTGLAHAEKKLLKTTKESLDIFEKQILGLKIRQQKLNKKLEQTAGAYIEVSDKIIAGSRIAIQHRYVVAPKDYPAGKFTIREDRICRI